MACVAALVVSACGGDGGTDVAPSPARLVRVSVPTDTVMVGGVLDPPMSVRVVGALGSPVEGVPVRFSLVSGPGRVQTSLAVSDTKGVAEAAFQAGGDLGESLVRVDVPSVSQVAPLQFHVVTTPAGTVKLAATGGDGQTAEGGTQLALPFALDATTPSGTKAGGVRIVWDIADGPAGARLTSDTTFTDPTGRTQNLLTLGAGQGSYTVHAFATGGVKTDTVSFAATAVTSLTGAGRIDSVSPLPLRPGQEATLYGSGFGTDVSAVQVLVEGVAGQVLAVESSRIRFMIPAFADRCLPARQVGVRALLGGQPTNGRMVTLAPSGTELNLALGQAATMTGTEALACLQLPASDSTREYLVVAGNADQTAAGMTPLRLIVRAPQASSTTTAEGDLRIRASTTARLAGPTGDAYSLPLAIQARAVSELARKQIAGRGGLLAPQRSVTPQLSAVPSAGDSLTFSFAVQSDLSVSCDATSDPVHAVVRSVGNHVILAEDVKAPANGFDQTTLDALASEFDSKIFPTDENYFGDPADLDGNGRIILLLTPRVNALTPRGSAAVVGGFFLPIDLVDNGDGQGGGLKGPNGETCPASNEGEILYLPVPDPAGTFSDAQRVDQVLRGDRNAMAHELQHLISAEQRLVIGGGDFSSIEEVWLGEGLSHVAEEVVGLRELGFEPGQNITWNRIIDDPAELNRFNAFELDDFARLSLYMLQPGAAPVLSTSDPGGLQSLQMRGFAWAFLRWLADRQGVANEPAFFRDLARGGSNQSRGVANIEQATGDKWDDLISAFALSLAADDRAPATTDASYQIATWNLPSIFQGLHDNPSSGGRFPLAYPLALTSLPFETAAVDFDTRSSTDAYFQLTSAADSAPPLAIHLASQSGGVPPTSASPQVLVLRLR